MARLCDIEAAGEDIGGDQDLGGAAAELLDGAVPLLVVQLAGDASAPVALRLQLCSAVAPCQQCGAHRS